MILPVTHYNSVSYLGSIKRRTFLIYWVLLIMTITSVAALPFIRFNISVKSPGLLRPMNEKTEIVSSVSTTIDTIYFKEGDAVKKGDIIIQLRKRNISIKRNMNDFEIRRQGKLIADLIVLTNHKDFNARSMPLLQSPVLKQESTRLILQLSELSANLKKVNRELYIDSVLLADKVIAPKEMFDKMIEYEKLNFSIKAIKEQQLATWQQELVRCRLEKRQLENANQQLNEDSNFYSLKAPVNGVLQSFNKYYQGSLVQAGDALAVISPEAEMIAECYINTRDIGLLKPNQPTYFQVDAFDYNYFGILTGRVLSIDNDYVITGNAPVFKVRCLLDSKQLRLKNGFTGELKKGMTVQARFLITSRSLWQLLFDKMDDWVNPNLSNV